MKTSEYAAVDAARVQIEILERSENILIIRWVEPGRCHYGEQRWRRRCARASGVCVVSRRAIRRGDAVFRPAERPAPSNASAMIAVEAFGYSGRRFGADSTGSRRCV
ncbi:MULTISPECIES: DUF3331 domain-containing protein [unclassified Paraburkholderia]|uniref:DUF3331 domain-containing protein n=1 Tax=unclassified Paraburkholderia TaxID=2615204 RepID=UPI0020B8C9CF|nr:MULTISPECIES: DUF3331 domain-containing protein [unclassified Paraburkholderia]MCP3716269.1 DUF3331 domain-containing protein [Paraburkholderia sp. CNPSo 3281]MCX5541085.1 DUF3331 domain-containing protein [Paraburkholderia sp. CNPSo 3076]